MGAEGYCEECFVGWREGAAECWQCGHPVSITKAEGDALLERAAMIERIAVWGERARRW